LQQRIDACSEASRGFTQRQRCLLHRSHQHSLFGVVEFIEEWPDLPQQLLKRCLNLRARRAPSVHRGAALGSFSLRQGGAAADATARQGLRIREQRRCPTTSQRSNLLLSAAPRWPVAALLVAPRSGLC
jgi:hypothetical protein